MIDNELLTKLLQNLLEILDDDKYYDIEIEVGSEPYVKVFRAHTVILYYRSPYLKRILSTSKKNNGILTHVKLPNILPDIFEIILRYIYGGRIFLEEYDTLYIIKILVAASELSLQELISYIQSFLIENKASWMEQNFDFIYKTCFKNDSFLELQKYCIELVSKGSDKIFKSLDFSSIPEKLLVSIIQDGNHQMSEFQVWEHVLEWGLAQNPELPSNLADYSKDDFDALKNTLQQFIPFIRFYNLTSKEFLDKVLPYEEILPKELYKDLLKTFLSLLDPNSKPSNEPKPSKTHITKEIKLRAVGAVDSKIIKYQHTELILKWIDRLKITDKLTSPYDFKLLFRASRDGANVDKFHQTCDNKSRTVTIVKLEKSNEILGGYNPIEWKSDGKYGITKDSFIFSFKNNDRIEEIEDHILSRVINENRATYNHHMKGPSFGCDLIIWGGSKCGKDSYEKLIRNTTGSFSVEECEVFQIV